MRDEELIPELELTMLLRNNRLKKLRMERGITQAELGRAVGVSGPAISHLECLQYLKIGSGASLALRKKVASFFDKEEDWLFPPWLEGLFERTKTTKELSRGDVVSLRSCMIEKLLPETPLDKALRKESWVLVKRAIEALSQREQFVIKGRYGLDGSEPLTLDDIKLVLGVSRQRVQQIQDGACKKMQRSIDEADNEKAI